MQAREEKYKERNTKKERAESQRGGEGRGPDGRWVTSSKAHAGRHLSGGAPGWLCVTVHEIVTEYAPLLSSACAHRGVTVSTGNKFAFSLF